MPTTFSNPPSNIIGYRPQLDGLRFCAVFFVLVYHFLPMFQVIGHVLNLGVMLVFFFVLSSYLITQILLHAKQKGLDGGHAKYKVAFVFLFRRTLRIFPAYYFYLLIIMLLPIAGAHVRENAEMYILYLSNYELYARQTWEELTPHLWTLAVEEQFYLVWPWLILYTSHKNLPKALFIVIMLGVLSRVVLSAVIESPGAEAVTLQVLTATCIDGFGLGGFLAYRHYNGHTHNPILKKLLYITFPLWIMTIFSGYPAISIVFDRLFVALLAMVVIEGANKGYTNRFGRFLQNKYILYLAKISYGIYLYHVLVAYLFWKILNRVTAYLITSHQFDITPVINVIANPWISFVCYCTLAVAMAAASWHFLEKPANNLKRFFIYTAPKVSVTQAKESQLANQ